MSDVTNVLLTYDLFDGDPARIDEINNWLGENCRQIFREVGDQCVGGSKRLECMLYAAAINYFPEEEFIAYLRSLTWEVRDSVQLLLKRQEDLQFSVIDI